MKHVRMTAQFDAPIEKVFELSTDYQHYPEWNVSYSAVDQVSGPYDKVGTRFHTTMKLLGRQDRGLGRDRRGGEAEAHQDHGNEPPGRLAHRAVPLHAGRHRRD